MTNIITNINVEKLDTVQYITKTVYDLTLQYGPFILVLVAALGVSSFIIIKKVLKDKPGGADTETIRMIIREAQQPTLEGIQRISENLKSFLGAEQVETILALAESLFICKVVDICKELQSVTLTNQELENQFKQQIEVLFYDIDKELFKIPNVQSGVRDTKSRIKSINDRSSEFVDIIIKNPRYDSLKKSCDVLIKSIARNDWYL